MLSIEPYCEVNEMREKILKVSLSTVELLFPYKSLLKATPEANRQINTFFTKRILFPMIR
jgi:hypothetical protein